MLNTTTSPGTNRTEPYIEPGKLRNLHALEKKILWLSSWIIHNANHLRPKRDGLKVGGHQASSASVVSILTALFFDVLRPEDRIAIKPHASPVFHAIQYLNGRQSLEKLQNFRAFNGAQAYPSRTKDTDDVDFSTGSEGLGAALTIFSSLVQEYAAAKGLSDGDAAKGRMIAVLGDAELDEGNLYEALLEGWKHTVRNVWWIVDYNRQSLDRVLEDRSSQRIQEVLQAMGWNVVVLKYGKRLQHAFAREGGDALLQWIDNCPNSLYSALVYRGGAAWRERLNADIGTIAGVRSMLEDYDDDALAALMTNLAGHDIESLLEAFHGTRDETSTCFLAYTIKGYGLPFAGHKDNHAALMSVEQMDLFKRSMGIDDGEEWDPLGGLAVPAAELREFIAASPFARSVTRHYEPPAIAIPAISAPSRSRSASTQEGFGRILSDIARTQDDFARRVVTTSPDVTISTNLGGWVNRRGVFGRRSSTDDFGTTEMRSVQKWALSPEGQHIELGIAENNLFLTLTALGLSAPLHNARLLPIGTVYDTFIGRGLDALNYGCYQDARFLLVGTPSGNFAGSGGRSASVHDYASHRYWPAQTEVLRTELRRRSSRDHALELRVHAAQGRRFRVPAALDPKDRTAATRNDRRPRRERRGRWLLADRTRASRRRRAYLHGRRRCRGNPGMAGDAGGYRRNRSFSWSRLPIDSMPNGSLPSAVGQRCSRAGSHRKTTCACLAGRNFGHGL